MSRYWESVETAKAISGRVITVAYMRQPIISRYFVFWAGVSKVAERCGDPGLRSKPTSMGVTAVRVFSSPKRPRIARYKLAVPMK